jgi:hypothetical protein
MAQNTLETTIRYPRAKGSWKVSGEGEGEGEGEGGGGKKGGGKGGGERTLFRDLLALDINRGMGPRPQIRLWIKQTNKQTNSRRRVYNHYTGFLTIIHSLMEISPLIIAIHAYICLILYTIRLSDALFRLYFMYLYTPVYNPRYDVRYDPFGLEAWLV